MFIGLVRIKCALKDLKLTFDDVLIRPKSSTLVSRSDVNLEREIGF